MLKGLDPLLTPELLMRLAAMGHGEWAAVVDANFTADHLSGGRSVIRLPGHALTRVCRAITSVMPLADDVPAPAAYMRACGRPDEHRTPAQQAVVDDLANEGLAVHRFEGVERFAFYERVKAASLIVQSGEDSAYGNVLLCKGVINL